MGAARAPLARLPGLSFFKLFGTGSGEGFTLKPNTQVWAILGSWTDADAAARGLDAPVFARWRRKAAEAWTL
ncbi:MAG: spheroidene monooxygenase, partial [Pseudomonadota bacterium]